MTEIWFAATGAKHWMDLFESTMQNHTYMLSGIGPNGQKFQSPYYGIFEPIQIYRYIVPKDGLGLALKTIRADASIPAGMKQLPLFMMRKALGLKEIPKDITLPQMGFPIAADNIDIVPIGIKDDGEGVVPSTGVKQELI